MPTSSPVARPASPPSSELPTPQPAQQDKNGNDSSDGFHKALGHARDSTAQGDAPRADATATTQAETRQAANHASQHTSGHDDTEDASQHKTSAAHDKKTSDTIANATIAITPNLILRPVAAAGSGKSLPVTVTSGKAGKGAQTGIHALLSSLENGAGKKLARTATSTSGNSVGTSASGTDTEARLSGAFLRAATQGDAGRKKDDNSIDLARIGTFAPTPQPTSTPTQTGAVHQLQIPSAPTSPEFAQSLSQHVAWLGGQQIKQANIQLHPKDLGPLNVNVQVKHDKVDVSFAVQNPATVHALQQTLPQLDTLLAQQGLNLGQAQVGQQHNPQQHGSHAQGGNGGSGHADSSAGTDTAVQAPLPARQLAVGLVDDFA